MKIKALFAVLLVLLCYAAWPKITGPLGQQTVKFIPATKECGAAGKLKYCVHTAAAGTGPGVIYHLHGRNLDESIWNDDTYFTALVQQYWQTKDIKPPKVVTISYGGVWLLAPKGRAADSGLLETFLADVSAIESKHALGEPRALLGESMGGLNVLVAGLTPRAKFSKIASLCPGLYLDSPFSSLDVLMRAVERTGADPKIVLGITMLVKNYVQDEDEWDAFNPFKRLEALTERPELYLSNGLYDAYGNFEGSEAFAKKAKELGYATAWHPLYGGHCAVDVSSVGEFLVR